MDGSRSRGRFPKTRARQAPRIRARTEETDMTIKKRDPEFLHPDAVAQLQGLTDADAVKHPPIVRERDGVHIQQRRVGRRVRCCEVEAPGGPASGSGALAALMRSTESEFGRLLPLLAAELRSGGVPDPDAIETGSCFKSNCIPRSSRFGWNRGGSGLLRVRAGFASSRLRRVRFVCVRGGAESMESGGQSLFALFSGFGFGVWIDHASHTLRCRRPVPVRRFPFRNSPAGLFHK